MLFVKISNANILFDKKIFIWKFYITNKTLFTIKQVKIVNSKEFVIMTLDADSKTFVVYMVI